MANIADARKKIEHEVALLSRRKHQQLRSIRFPLSASHTRKGHIRTTHLGFAREQGTGRNSGRPEANLCDDGNDEGILSVLKHRVDAESRARAPWQHVRPHNATLVYTHQRAEASPNCVKVRLMTGLACERRERVCMAKLSSSTRQASTPVPACTEVNASSTCQRRMKLQRRIGLERQRRGGGHRACKSDTPK